MTARSPDPIDALETRRRRDAIRRLARSVGFVGRVEYRHEYSQTGGAQYARGVNGDSIVVYAEAFVRDADPDDFSLLAIIAHERGHQLLAREPRLFDRMANISLNAEEVLASLLGALVLEPGDDRDALIAKATVEVLSAGNTSAEAAVGLIQDLWNLLEALL